MPGSTTYVTKSAGIKILDRHLRKPSKDLITHIKETPSIFDLLMNHQIAPTAKDQAHIRNEIAAEGPPSEAWWKSIPREERSAVLRAAYVKAIRLATENAPPNDPKPIVTYHVKGIDDPEAFDVVLSQTDFEIHVMWITPKPNAEAQPAPATEFKLERSLASESTPTLEPETEEEVIPPGLSADDDRMWLVANPTRVERVRQRFEQNNPGKMKVEFESGIPGAMILRIANY